MYKPIFLPIVVDKIPMVYIHSFDKEGNIVRQGISGYVDNNSIAYIII